MFTHCCFCKALLISRNKNVFLKCIIIYFAVNLSKFQYFAFKCKYIVCEMLSELLQHLQNVTLVQ